MNVKRKLRDIDYFPKGLREYTENDLADMLDIFNETALIGVNSPVTGPVSIEELSFLLFIKANRTAFGKPPSTNH